MPEEDDHENDGGQEVGSFEELVSKVPGQMSVDSSRLVCTYKVTYRIGPQDAKVSHA